MVTARPSADVGDRLVGRPPDFVGVGVQKAGTSWWYELLCTHPACSSNPAAKELHFFDRFWRDDFGASDVAAYHRAFDVDPALRTGEWTPRYLYDPWVPPLLPIAAPDARLLVLLRDPVERYRSGVTHAIEHDGWPTHALVASDAFRRGLYGQQLDLLSRSVPPERVLVLQYEACVADPLAQLRRTYAFVGVDPAFTPPDVDRPVQRTTGEKAPLPARTAAAFADAYRDDLVALSRLVPELDLARWPAAVAAGVA